MIKSQTYSINNLLITNEVLSSYVNNFWLDVFYNIIANNQDKHLMILVKVHFLPEGTDGEDFGYRTLGHLRRVNFKDKDIFIDYLVQRLGILTEAYLTHPITKITFTYIIKKGLAVNTAEHLENIDDNRTTIHNFNNMNLPISMNPSDYGKIEVQNFIQDKDKTFERFVVTNTSKTFRIDVYKDWLINKVTMLGNINLSWIDTVIGHGDNNFFKREIGKSILYFNHGEIILKKKLLSAKPFKTVNL